MSRKGGEAQGVEFLSSLEARRTSIAAIGLLTASAALFILVTQYAAFPPGQARVTLLQIPLIALILIFRKRDLSAWFGIASLVTAALGTIYTDSNSDARISASTTIFIATYCGVVMLQGIWQPLWIVVMAALWTQITPVVVLPFTFGDIEVNLRWSTWVQLLVAGTWTMLVWNREYAKIRQRDEAALRMTNRRVEALATSERVRIWRESLVRVHETVLNDIRSVVDAAEIHGDRLTRQLRSSETYAPPQHSRISLSELIRPLNVMQSEQRLIIGKLPDVHLGQQRATALRSAILEIMRNAYRHAGVTSLRIEAVADREAMHLSISSDSGTFAIPSNPSGIGTGVVLQEALATLQATLDQDAGVITVHLPWESSEQREEVIVDIEGGRALLAAIGAGNAIGGLLGYVAVAIAFGWQGKLMAIAAMFTAVVSIYAIWKRHALTPLLLIVTGAVATSVPIVARYLVESCDNVELLLIVTALASLGFFALLSLAPNLRWWIIGAPFIASLTVLNDRASGLCTDSVAPAILSAYSAPLLMGLTLVTTTMSLRRNAQLERIRLAEVRDSAAAEAATQLGEDLHTAVTTARAVLSEIARTGSIDAEQRLQLRCLDSEIRATIQVDPETSGGVALAARMAIHEASNQMVPTRVLVLRDSGDRRDLPPEVMTALRALLCAATDGSASVQILSNNEEDVLTLTLSESSRQRAGLPDGWTFDFESGIATVDAGSDSEAALFLVRRRVTTHVQDSSTLQVLAPSP